MKTIITIVTDLTQNLLNILSQNQFHRISIVYLVIIVIWQNYSNSFLLVRWIFLVFDFIAKWNLKRVCWKNLHVSSRIFLIFWVFSMTSPGSPWLFPKRLIPPGSPGSPSLAWTLKFYKNGVPKTSQIYRKTSVLESLLPSNFIKKETLAQMFFQWILRNF